MSNTLAEVYEKVYDLMWEKTTSTTYPVTSAVSLINTYIDRICKWQVINLLNPQVKYRAWNLSFLEKNVYFSNIQSQTISVATTVWATEITVDTTDYPTSGAVLINWEIALYTGKSATQLTWVTWITTIHPVGSRVTVVYQLPANITKPFQVYDTKGSEIEYQDFRYNDKERYYTILTQDKVDYIYFNSCAFNNMFIKYYEKPTKLVYATDDQEEIILPDDYGITVVAQLVAGEMKYTKWEEQDLASNNLNNWYIALQEMYDYYAKKAINRGWINITYPWDPALYWKNVYNDKRDYANV